MTSFILYFVQFQEEWNNKAGRQKVFLYDFANGRVDVKGIIDYNILKDMPD